MVAARRKALAAVSLIAVLSILLSAAPVSASHSRLEETRRQIRATRQRLARAMGQDAEILRALNGLTAQLNRHRAALAAARARLERIDLGIRTEQRRLAKLAAQSEQRRSIIDQRARTLYIMGPVSDISAMSGATSLDDYVGRVGALDFVLRFDKGVLEDLERIKDQARKTRAALEARRKEAAAAKEEIAERFSVVAELVSAKREAHDAMSSRISSMKSQLAALQREQARIVALIRSRSSVGTGPVSRSGFAWPIRGAITSPYGPRWGSFHTGMDIDCETGDRIGASKAGRVIAAEWAGGYGLMVAIDHGNGVSSLYAHNSRLLVSRGQRVSQRQAISLCGNTGNSTGDHLHFEIRINGRHTNPRPFLP